MKKTLLTLSLLAVAISIMAGGIVHNTNQSASFIRMPARDAVLGIDAVYYNPAGMFKLNNGFHFSLNNQYITQTRNIKSTFTGMNRNEFEGGVVAPLFPSVYAVYKMDRFAFSFGFNPIGGGGSALFEDGLPSFEMSPSSIPASLSAAGIPTTQYSMDVEFEGKSVIFGFQGGVAFKVRDELSISAGLRYVTVNNSYNGYLRNLQINPNYPALGYTGTMKPATTFFSDFSTFLTGVSTNLASTGNSLQPIITGGGGNVPLANGTAAGLTAEQVAQLQGGITQLGGNPAGMTIAQAQQFYLGASATYATNATTMSNNAQATRDLAVDAGQKGSGLVPIIGMNFQFAENFNMGVKYEFRSKINVKNDTKVDDVGLYPDKLEVPNDMPAMLSVGLQYAPVNWLNIHAGLHHYFDRKVKYGKTDGSGKFISNATIMESDFEEYALGLEFQVTKKLLLSIGYLRTQTGVLPAYQSDLSHSLSTNSFGGGLRYHFTEKIGVNLGAMNTSYIENTKDFGGYKEMYNRKAFTIGLGVDVSL